MFVEQLVSANSGHNRQSEPIVRAVNEAHLAANRWLAQHWYFKDEES